ncbi:hypothetical protein SEA_BLINN1_53 [Mycobacterium phage Blinn1]|uniref:Uncharacterized protein n=2 Tax=Gladiatorvirus TaxID=2948726 RepID=A0A2U8UQ91_9CAUD|nr:hypothetical protein KIP53_gp056 [Mycobacterium phage Blinn1]YP_010061276.1 hypothetical protein KIP55_gp058 [Mycobacterium phage Priamo]AWN05815.1 hypothetical protein SEA_PRIAMO_52 [Mycobacterium phage Priamo]QGJ94814.1 hypothetical protein SEA_BLINN1_53 [Mycobacterium phage Blinn1]
MFKIKAELAGGRTVTADQASHWDIDAGLITVCGKKRTAVFPKGQLVLMTIEEV